MANQPLPSRPWLILGSPRPVAPPPAASSAPAAASPAPEAQPQAQPQPQPQPPAPRPIFRPTFGQALKSSTQPQQPPPQPPTAATAAPPFQVGNVSSVPSYASQKTTPTSEKIKPPSPPSSALTLPPAHVKSTPEPIEQKTMLIEKPNPPFKPSNGGLQKDVGDTAKPSSVPDYEKLEKTKDMESKDHKGNHKKAHSRDNGMKIITISGNNKGAIMKLNPASKKHDPQGNSNTMATPSPLMHVFMNSNVQAVNNSMLVNTSCTSHDPGVHVFFSRGSGRGLHLRDFGEGQNN